MSTNIISFLFLCTIFRWDSLTFCWTKILHYSRTSYKHVICTASYAYLQSTIFTIRVSNIKPKSVEKEQQWASNLLLQHDKNGYYHFEKMVALATEGLEPFFQNILREKTSKENALIITEYLIAVKREINISTGYTKANIETLVCLSKFHSNKKNFKEMTREDV